MACAAPGAQAAFPAERLRDSPAEVRAYWTEERMREAVPASRLLEDVEPPSAPLPASEVGRQSVIGSTGPTRPIARSGPLDELLGDGSGRSARATEIENPRPAPLRTHGKVFFTLPDGLPLTGDDYACSATVINSLNRRLVITAGHCVYGFGRFASKWMFVPAKDGDSEPFGRWTAARLATTRQWREDEDIRYDVGMARMAKRNSRRLQRVVGARGIGFNLDPNRYHAYGYPAEDPFPGNRLYLCDSPAEGSDETEDRPRPRRIDCDMTGGSSGGGWVVREELVNSVVSYGYECTIPFFPCNNPEEGKLFGPYFGNTIRDLYRAERRRAKR